jgi:hypothetical protein
MSEDHLNRYVDEFCHRHNTAALGTMGRIDTTLEGTIGRRLTYKELIA